MISLYNHLLHTLLTFNEHLLLMILLQAPICVGERQLDEVRDVEMELGEGRAVGQTVEEPVRRGEMILNIVPGTDQLATTGQHHHLV